MLINDTEINPELLENSDISIIREINGKKERIILTKYELRKIFEHQRFLNTREDVVNEISSYNTTDGDPVGKEITINHGKGLKAHDYDIVRLLNDSDTISDLAVESLNELDGHDTFNSLYNDIISETVRINLESFANEEVLIDDIVLKYLWGLINSKPDNFAIKINDFSINASVIRSVLNDAEALFDMIYTISQKCDANNLVEGYVIKECNEWLREEVWEMSRL